MIIVKEEKFSDSKYLESLAKEISIPLNELFLFNFFRKEGKFSLIPNSGRQRMMKKLKIGRRDFSGNNFAGMDLNYLKMADCNCNNANFSNCSLTYANFSNSRFVDVNFTGANLFNVNFRYASLDRAKMVGCNLENVQFWHANLTNANLKDVVSVKKANFDGTMVLGMNLDGANLNKCKLTKKQILTTENWQKAKNIPANYL